MDSLLEIAATPAIAPGDWLPLVLGGILLLFGWLLYRVVLTGAGGVLGGACGVGAGLLAAGLFADGSPEWVAVAAGVGGGILGAAAGIAAARFLHAAAFFLVGAAAGGWGFAEVFLLARANGYDWAQSDVVFAFGIPVAAVAAGGLAVAFSRYAIAVVSAGAGTLLAMRALDWPVTGAGAAGIFVGGVIVQCLLAPGGKRRGKDDD